MRVWQRLVGWSGLALLGLTGQAYAQSNSGRPQSDFLFDTQYAFTTSKSKLVASNDTGTALRYGIGGYAGSSSNLAFLIHFDRDVTKFQLNDSKIDMNWQDTKVRYHLSYFYLGALFTRLEMKATLDSVELIDAAGSGMGANAGMLFGIGRGGSFMVDIVTATLPTMKNSLDQTLAIKQRMDIDLGASIDLTAKLLDLTFGYKMRTLTVTTDSSYKEVLTSTYVGLRTSFNF